MPRLPRLSPRPNLRVLALLTAVTLVAGYFGWRGAAVAVVSQRIQRAAHDRGLMASWQSLRIGFPAQITISGLLIQ